jgi:superfamily I DNA/RNA helicase
MEPTSNQEEIIKSKCNVIVSASAGTGKTFTLVEKIKYEIEQNKSYKVIAAITFTIKATSEIKKRIGFDNYNHYIGTINSFAINEIIIPFMKDVYGNDFNKNLDTNYTKKFTSFIDGIKMIQNSSILGVYSNPNNNFIFELALDILKKSKSCKLYLKSKYFKLYIDEYQDCDIDMNNFFMYICDELKIEIFIVGDSKQSIYTWRGADPKIFKEIQKKSNFTSLYLSENFRSCKQIQNYSNLLFEETQHLYEPSNSINQIICINSYNDNWFETIGTYIDSNKSLAILRYSNDNAKLCAEDFTNKLYDCSFIPRTPIADISTNDHWFYMAVANYNYKKYYSIFDFIETIPNTEIPTSTRNMLKTLLDKIKNKNSTKYTEFKATVRLILNLLNLEPSETNISKLYKTITTRFYECAFNVDLYNTISTTFHSSKGLEFEQVIIFSEDYHLPTTFKCYTNNQKSSSITENSLQEIALYNHYVATTRAKNKLIIVNKINKLFGASNFEYNLESIFYKNKKVILPEIITYDNSNN